MAGPYYFQIHGPSGRDYGSLDKDGMLVGPRCLFIDEESADEFYRRHAAYWASHNLMMTCMDMQADEDGY